MKAFTLIQPGLTALCLLGAGVCGTRGLLYAYQAGSAGDVKSGAIGAPL